MSSESQKTLELPTLDYNSKIIRWGISLVGTVSFFLLWILISDVFELFTPQTLPSPFAVVNSYLEFRSLINENLWPTLWASAIGFSSALILAVTIAILFTLSKRLRDDLMPLMVSGNSIPRLTLAPVIIFYVGGFDAKYLISAWVAFFPLFMNSLDGMEQINDEEQNLLRVMDATKWQEYKHIRLPNAIPYIFDGMKVGLTLAIVGAVVGEFVASDEGMGYLALVGLMEFQTDLVLAITGVMGIVSVIGFYGLFILQDKLVYWQDTNLFGE